uniref:Uncharacterized protein n=1 Tax=Rhizophora mucronata TaxID=61149 RepID=A0A2P2K1N5_RHIMU
MPTRAKYGLETVQIRYALVN